MNSQRVEFVEGIFKGERATVIRTMDDADEWEDTMFFLRLDLDGIPLYERGQCFHRYPQWWYGSFLKPIDDRRTVRQTILDMAEELQAIERACKNNDIDLARKLVVLFNGKKYWAYVTLSYEGEGMTCFPTERFQKEGEA